MLDQTQERCEMLANENRRLKDDNVKLTQANKRLAQQIIERNETCLMLEQECRQKLRRKAGVK